MYGKLQQNTQKYLNVPYADGGILILGFLILTYVAIEPKVPLSRAMTFDLIFVWGHCARYNTYIF